MNVDALHNLLFYWQFYEYSSNAGNCKTVESAFAALSNLSLLSLEKLKLRFGNAKPFIESTLNSIKENQEAFIAALQSPHFYILQPALSSYFQGLQPKEQDAFLEKLTLHSIEQNHECLVSRCLSLLTNDQLNSLFQLKFVPSVKLKEFAEIYLYKMEIKNKLYLQKNKSWISSEITSIVQKFLQVFTHYLNLLVSSLESFTEGGAPKSAWDAAFQLEVYYRMLTIPKTIFAFIQERLPGKFQNQTVFIFSWLSIGTFIYSYRKWLEPKPEEIPYASNLTALLEHDPTPVFGRDVEIEKTVDQLMKNLIAPTREHPLIVGSPGVGKTKFLSGVAKKLSERGITLHRIHASQLLNSNSLYTNKTAFDEILNAVKRHKEKIAIAIDDLQLLMKNKENRPALLSLLETEDPNKNLPLFIGVTPIDFKKDEEISQFYEKQGYARRFYPIELEEMQKSALTALLTHTAEKSCPYFDLDDKIYSDIVNFEKDPEDRRLEPARSLQKLSQVLREKKDELEGEKEKKEIESLRQNLEEIELHITTVKDEELINAIKLKKETEKKIQDAKKTFQKKELRLQTAIREKAQLQKKEFQLKTFAEKIINGETAYESEFMAGHFYLLPAKNKRLKKIV